MMFYRLADRLVRLPLARVRPSMPGAGVAGEWVRRKRTAMGFALIAMLAAGVGIEIGRAHV